MIETDLAIKPVANIEGRIQADRIRANGEIKDYPGCPDLEKKEYTVKELQPAVDTANKLLLDNNITDIQCKIHEETGRMVVKIVDTRTEEVISEIPSEKLLDYAAAMDKFIGLIVDKKG